MNLFQRLFISTCITGPLAGAAQGFEKWHGTCKVMSNLITIYNTYIIVIMSKLYYN